MLSDAIKPLIQNKLETGQNILPVFVRAERPFDYAVPENVNRVMDKIRELDGEAYANEALRGYLSRGSWQIVEKERIQDAIKAAGFDSFYVLEAGTKNLAVYNPNQIKSATGNIGTYGETGDIRY